MKKKTALTTAITIVLSFSVLAGAQLVNLAGANVMFIPAILRIYISGDGSVTPSTVPIQQVGNVYTFKSDLTNSCIIIQRDNIVIDGNGFCISSFTFGYHTGITLENRRNVTIKNAYIREFSVGIKINNSSNNTVTGNNIKCGSCVRIHNSSSHNQIVGNNMRSFRGFSYGNGISGDGSFNNITGNNFATVCGITMNCSNTIISQNNFETKESINLGDNSQHNLITKNTMAGGLCGVTLYGGSSNNVVFGNNITQKTECGIEIKDTVNNTLYCNNFVGNTKNVNITGISNPNFWDNGTIGNYWSNYDGIDSDGDGIGDTPHVIDNKNKDNYPLMNNITITELETPNLIPEFPTWTPTLIALALLTTAATIYKQKLHRRIRNKKRLSYRNTIKRE